MTIFRIARALLLAATTTLAGCAVNQMDANVIPGNDVSQFKTFYVAKHSKDKYNVAEEIEKALEQHGVTASVGPADQKPTDAEVIVTYEDKWMWDITLYLLQLDVTFSKPSGFPIATAHSMHTSLTRKSPTEMAMETTSNIFNKNTGH